MSTTIPITASRYNTLRSLVNKILGNSTLAFPNYGYGQLFSTTAVVGDFDVNGLATDKVTAEQYENLYIDLIRLRVHQVGVSSTTINPFVEGDFESNPSTADKIELAYIQALETLATNIETDRLLIDAATQATEVNLLSSAGNPIFSTRSFATSGSWNGTITHIVKVTFDDAQQRRQFFNAGGEIRFNASVNYAGSQAKTIDWQTQLSAMGTISFKANQTVSNNGIGSSYAIGNYNLTSTYQLCYDQTGGATYARNHYYIYALQLNDREVQFRIDFVDGQPNNITFGIDEPVLGDFTSTLRLLQPDGSVTINGITVDTVVIPSADLPVGVNITTL
jgi:hypothetical protein